MHSDIIRIAVFVIIILILLIVIVFCDKFDNFLNFHYNLFENGVDSGHLNIEKGSY